MYLPFSPSVNSFSNSPSLTSDESFEAILDHTLRLESERL